MPRFAQIFKKLFDIAAADAHLLPACCMIARMLHVRNTHFMQTRFKFDNGTPRSVDYYLRWEIV